MSKWPSNGHWVTLENDQHVLIEDGSGRILAGLGTQNNGKTFREAFGKSNSQITPDEISNTASQIGISQRGKGVSTQDVTSQAMRQHGLDAGSFGDITRLAENGLSNSSAYASPDVIAHAYTSAVLTRSAHLSGSEKQVNWANDLRAKSLREMVTNYLAKTGGLKAAVEKRGTPLSDEEQAGLARGRATQEAAINALLGATSAKEIIDQRGGSYSYWAKRADDMQKGMSSY